MPIIIDNTLDLKKIRILTCDNRTPNNKNADYTFKDLASQDTQASESILCVKMEETTKYILKMCHSQVRSFTWRLSLADRATLIIIHQEYISSHENRKIRNRGEIPNVVQGPIIDIVLVPPNHQ